jgi:hypothetical protein
MILYFVLCRSCLRRADLLTNLDDYDGMQLELNSLVGAAGKTTTRTISFLNALISIENSCWFSPVISSTHYTYSY